MANAHASTSRATGHVDVQFVPPKRNASGVSLKGKERALQHDDGDGSAFQAPIVTFRHILGKGDGGAGNPLRCIAHIDIDAAYAAFEMARLGIDPKQPLAVQQWNGLIAVNYPARAHGITRHEPPAEALKKCPDLMLVHVATYRIGDPEPGYWTGAKPETHKVSLDPYRRESLRILKCFSEFGPVVEKASIDESYLDVTMPVRAELLKRFPKLGQLPPGADLDSPLPTPAELGVKLDWPTVGNLVPIEGQAKEELPKPPDKETGTLKDTTSTDQAVTKLDGLREQVSDAVQADLPEDEPELSWSDVALYLGAEIVKKCRSAVEERLGYTCSAGIAPNKMLAKLCSAWKKPNNQTVLRRAAIPAFLRPMPFQKIRNLGGKLGNQVSDVHKANTVGDLLDITLPEMQAKLGDESGTWLYEIIRGIDYTEVEAKTQVKSMISSKNFRPYITKYSEAVRFERRGIAQGQALTPSDTNQLHWVSILATELHLRLREARETSPGLWPKTLVFSRRSPDYVVRSHQAAFPFTSKLDIAYITRHGEKLLRTAIGESPNVAPGSKGPSPDLKIGPYNNMMLSLTGLDRAEEGQKAIESFFTAAATGNASNSAAKSKRTETDEQDETTRKRQSSTTMTMAALAKRQKRDKEKDKKSSYFGPVADEVVVLDDSDESDDGNASNDVIVFAERLKLGQTSCARCKQTLRVPKAQLRTCGGEEQVKLALDRVEAEHADWHFARDVLDQDRQRKQSKVNGASLPKTSKANGAKKSSSSSSSSGTNGMARSANGTGSSADGKASKAQAGKGSGQQSLTNYFGS
ncbi:N-acetyltransferase eso1 [Microbotryomycetes sp. JL201]|nr:N-acetyltransferase eso1 [Microbotryomycetes sp. JL201]